ncbi:hypothetical protein CAPTEDRAFT_227249 [Capitella teleta]|uniref:Neurotransmitter-gated ion-channel ligand-binding domain-containing protein n=1 Tax=Capitella teleta TaxID=283909 RepID=R7U6S8_CAPTE|nr:hypothetical protein CAPTEDRAFT_227249 [Capitella teleta]|eukprot:ELT99361.1 hypothetical protein CAPTEDRAFT_227249 [Capitella teleta]
MRRFYFTLLVILAAHLGVDSRKNRRNLDVNPTEKSDVQQSMRNKLLHSYSRDDPPLPERATEVRIGFFIQDILPNVERKSLEVNFFFRQLWHDPRLAFDEEELGDESIRLSHSGSIWRPDTFFKNNRYVRSKETPSPEFLLSINATGHVWYVQSLNGEFTCPTLGEDTEDGVHHCAIYVESFGYKTDRMSLDWLSSPVDVDVDLIMSKFVLKNIKKRNCTNRQSGSFACLKILLTLQPRDQRGTTS